ncbi:EamA family transporter [Silvanigrella paludirubra]|uniref:EamA family transporter n=1 Tax=Silvanigrella paludirubra TaxID=2499159 RepID=A0A6N6VUQ7_9BACT|nr:DMT family transporter [Silvanigrella paludirubra]KAB8037565.1 EamA family transporter [Silvanigrella paludirubra]
MTEFIFIALLNGFIVGLSRAINGRLSEDIGAFKASFWNHIVGFVFLSILLIAMGSFHFETNANIPIYAYVGGFLGAILVAINSYTFTKIGATKSLLLLISGQMITSVILDNKNSEITSTIAKLIGICFIIFGVYLSKKDTENDENKNDLEIRKVG